MNIPTESDFPQKVCRFCHGLALASLLNEKTVLSENEQEHIELALDIGLAISYMKGDTSLCVLNEKYALVHIDLTEEDFLITVTDLSGRIKGIRKTHFDDRYFYDENVAFFIKDSEQFVSRYAETHTLIGASVLIPDGSERFRGTKCILTDFPRLTSMVQNSFPCESVLCTGKTVAVNKLTEYLPMSRPPILLLSKCGRAYTAGVAGVGSSLGEIRAAEDTAESLADALYNTVNILKPRRLLLDSCLSEKYGFDSSIFAHEMSRLYGIEVLRVSSRFASLGATGVMRQKFCESTVRKYLNSEKGRKLWNIIR